MMCRKDHIGLTQAMNGSLNAKCDSSVTKIEQHDSCSSPGGLGDTTDTAIFSDGLMAGSSVGGSCEYHQVLETTPLLKCAPGA